MSDAFPGNSVGGRWNVLRSGGGSDGLEVPSLPLEVRTAAGPVRLAVGSHGEARLLIPLAHGESLPTLEPGPALRIGTSAFMHRGSASRFLDLICLSRELESVFEEVVDELLARIAAGSGVAEAVNKTIDDFRALIVSRPERAPEKNRVAGLVGELVVLNRLLEISSTAWRAWTGPAGDRHDFRARATSLEAKASLRAGASVVTINGLEQLEPPAGGTLHLLHMVLEPVEGGLLNIAALGAQAIAKADDPNALRDLLQAAGCDDISDPAWNRYAFRLEGEQLYSVSSGFPRISASVFAGQKVPAGIVDATYQIDLGFAVNCAVPPARLDEVLQELAS